jgi:hypothetical protein
LVLESRMAEEGVIFSDGHARRCLALQCRAAAEVRVADGVGWLVVQGDVDQIGVMPRWATGVQVSQTDRAGSEVEDHGTEGVGDFVLTSRSPGAVFLAGHRAIAEVLDARVKALAQTGVSNVELFANMAEPMPLVPTVDGQRQPGRYVRPV